MGVISLTTIGALIYFMRNKVAKRLRKEAQEETIGQPAKITRRLYRLKKKTYFVK
jgi:hypothetical protein